MHPNRPPHVRRARVSRINSRRQLGGERQTVDPGAQEGLYRTACIPENGSKISIPMSLKSATLRVATAMP